MSDAIKETPTTTPTAPAAKHADDRQVDSDRVAVRQHTLAAPKDVHTHPHALLALQRTLGNQATQRVLARQHAIGGTPPAPFAQPTPSGSPHDLNRRATPSVEHTVVQRFPPINSNNGTPKTWSLDEIEGETFATEADALNAYEHWLLQHPASIPAYRGWLTAKYREDDQQLRLDRTTTLNPQLERDGDGDDASVTDEDEHSVEAAAKEQAVATNSNVGPDPSGPVAVMNPARIRLQKVSLSSEIHHLENLVDSCTAVLTQPWGFSFAAKPTQIAHVKLINEYVDKWNAGAEVAVMHAPGTGKKIQYTIGDCVYSTHEDSAQLYPISGTGVVRGNGPGDMYRILCHKKLDTPGRVINLCEGMEAMQTDEWKRQAALKAAGGHRSGVKMPKINYTPKKNVEKMSAFKRDPKERAAREALERIPPTPQFGLGEADE